MADKSSIAVSGNENIERINPVVKVTSDSIEIPLASAVTTQTLESVVVENSNTAKDASRQSCEVKPVEAVEKVTASPTSSHAVTTVSSPVAIISASTPKVSSNASTVKPCVSENPRKNALNLNVFFGLMRYESERLLTFTEGDWPISFISAESLANAGFFYLKNSDRVQCAFCEGVICSWEPNDIPLDEHKKHFPHCPFMMGYDVGNKPINQGRIRGVRSRVRRNICGCCRRNSAASMSNVGYRRRTYTVLPRVLNLDGYGAGLQKSSKTSSRRCRSVSVS